MPQISRIELVATEQTMHIQKMDANVTKQAKLAQSSANAQKKSYTHGQLQHPVIRLQDLYGNRYVQRIMDIARNGDDESDKAIDYIEGTIQRALGSGHPLDSDVRIQMEPAFGADFSSVCVHADTQADNLSQSLNARAFTTGSDIFFRQGEYKPGTSSGRELLAHELTHTLQQGDGMFQAKLMIDQPGDKYELEANRVARAVVNQERQSSLESEDANLIQRQIAGEEEELEYSVCNC